MALPTPESAQSTPIPSGKTAESESTTAIPSDLTAEDAKQTGGPSSATAELAQDTPLPTPKTAEGVNSTRIPSSFTANPAEKVTPPFPLNHARILYENKMQTYEDIIDNTGTSTAINALIPDTSSAWSFTQSGGSNAFRTDFSSPVEIDTVCIGAHNVFSVGGSIRIQYGAAPSGTFTTIANMTPESNSPIMVHLDEPVLATLVQISVYGANGDVEVGYVAAGVALQMQRPFFVGHTPITDSDVTQYYRAKTESGNIVGRSIRSQGFQTSYDWSNLQDAWYREYIPNFKESAKIAPIFIAWNLLEYPDDVGFGFVEGDISAAYTGPRKRRSMNFTLLGY